MVDFAKAKSTNNLIFIPTVCITPMILRFSSFSVTSGETSISPPNHTMLMRIPLSNKHLMIYAINAELGFWYIINIIMPPIICTHS